MEYADSVLSVGIATLVSLGFIARLLLMIVQEAERKRKEMRDCDIW